VERRTDGVIIIIIIIETFITRLLQLKNEHKRYIFFGKIDKKRLWLGLINIICRIKVALNGE